MAVGYYKDGGMTIELKKFFDALPPMMRDKAVGRIYAKALVKMRRAIRAGVPVASEPHTMTRFGKRYTYQPGNLKRAVSITVLRKNNPKDDPAAMVYISRSRRKDGWYAHFLEYGTADRRTTKGASRGSISTPTPFFRRGVDMTSSMVGNEVERAMARYAQRELDKQIDQFNRRAKRQLVNL